MSDDEPTVVKITPDEQATMVSDITATMMTDLEQYLQSKTENSLVGAMLLAAGMAYLAVKYMTDDAPDRLEVINNNLTQLCNISKAVAKKLIECQDSPKDHVLN